ncbi:MAG: NAD(P)/FAD-dependent oxidoreductase, partial [Rubripirellula sp.]
TAGGVKLDEVNAKTMESQFCKGLYIAGEVLNVDGPIGGYNFQAAFSTGRAAGIAAAKSLNPVPSGEELTSP